MNDVITNKKKDNSVVNIELYEMLNLCNDIDDKILSIKKEN